ncbi:MAG: hypothetical protein J6A42_08630 [Firmicutes bacterium]|nr:hypothetical protein [Bacillota bacterium]
MTYILAFLPSILSVAAILIALVMGGVDRNQLVLSIFVFSGLVLLANRYLEGYRMVNLPLMGAAIVFCALGFRRRYKK